MADGHQVFQEILKETRQLPQIRQRLIQKLERKFFKGKKIITYFTSLRFNVIIDNSDAEMIENLLQNMDASNGLIMVINSLGGSGLAAEQIVNICKSYSNNNFEIIVPKLAKSAGTMICLGANKIYMSKTSELGPIDPQIATESGLCSVHSIIESYDKLLTDAVATKGRIEPYLQQLANYKSHEIAEFRKAVSLSEKIAIDCLKNGMMKGKTEKQISEKIKPFTDPSITSSHGRPIKIDMAIKSGLKIEEIDLKSELWETIYELYFRSNHYVSKFATKVIETSKQGVEAPLPSQK